jgi:hypothetical protein
MAGRLGWVVILLVVCAAAGCGTPAENATPTPKALLGTWHEDQPGEGEFTWIRFRDNGTYESGKFGERVKDPGEVLEKAPFRMTGPREFLVERGEVEMEVWDGKDGKLADGPKFKPNKVKKKVSQDVRGLIQKLEGDRLEIVWVYADGSRSDRPIRYRRTG